MRNGGEAATARGGQTSVAMVGWWSAATLLCWPPLPWLIRREDAVNEIRILASINHVNVVR